MTKKDVIKYFGSPAAAASSLGITRQAVNNWGEYPSRESQLDCQIITEGKLKAEPRHKKALSAA